MYPVATIWFFLWLAKFPPEPKAASVQTTLCERTHWYTCDSRHVHIRT